jgi:type I restriction enzyme S subunit
VCVFEYGSGLTQRDRLGGSVPVFGSNGVVGYHNIAINRGPTIIIGRKGSIGQVNYSEIPCWPIDTTYYIDSSKTNCDLIWLYWLLKSLQLDLLNKATGVPGLNREDAYNQIVPLPPPEEQRRIATKIQELMQEVEHARTACEKQFEAAKALPATYLREVFESEEAKKWERKRLGEVCEFLDSMRIPVNDGERQKRIAGKKQTELYPYYGANGQVGWIDNFIFDEELVLLAEDGGFFGSFEKPIAYRVGGKCWVNNHAHVLRTNREIIDVDWLYFSLGIRPDIMCFVSGTTRPKLNQEQASKIPIPLPSILIQQRIAADLKGKMAEVENLESTIQNQQSALNSFPQAILRQAFNGEL